MPTLASRRVFLEQPLQRDLADKALGKIGKPEELSVCHEAGPCGYGLVRSLRQKGYATDVIAPSRVAVNQLTGSKLIAVTLCCWRDCCGPRAHAHRRSGPEGRGNS